MRRKSPYHIPLLPLLLCMMTVASCGSRSVMRELESIESILDDSPDSVRSRLDSIDASSLHGESRALYAMLRTQADYKCYVDIPGDSLIREATSYYGIRRRNWRAAMSWYSLGCVYTLQNNDTGAINAYLKSLSLFPDTLTRYYSYAEFKLGNLYKHCSMYNEALSSFGSCLLKSIRLKDSTTISYCNYHIATIHMYRRDTDTIDRVFHNLLSDRNLSDFLRHECLLDISKISLYLHNDADSAIKYARQYLESDYSGYSSDFAAYGILGDAYSLLGYRDSAYSCFNKSVADIADVYTRCNSYRRMYEMASEQCDTAAAGKYAHLYTTMLDSIVGIRSLDRVTSVMIDNDRDRTDRELRAYRKNIVMYSVLYILLFSTIVAVMFSLYFKKERNRREYYISMVDATRQKRLPELRPDAQYGDVLDYCMRRFRLSPSYALLCESSDCTLLNKDEKSAVIHDITVCFAELNALLQGQNANVNVRELYFCILTYIGCDNKIIEDITGLSRSTQRTVKYRLKEKIQTELFQLLFEPEKNEQVFL